MNSYHGFETIKNFNIKIDFCYLDGSHYYKDFKSDLDNFSKILKLENGYKGKICGDDYELAFSINPEREIDLIKMSKSLEIPVTRIGAFTNEKGVNIQGLPQKIVPFLKPGYDHI